MTTRACIRRGALAGLAYAVLALPMLGMELMRQPGGESGTLFTGVYLTAHLVALAVYIFFMMGFRALALVTENLLLEILCYLLVVFSAVDLLYILAETLLPAWVLMVMGFGILIVYGVLAILFGIALLRTSALLGGLGTAAGVLEIVLGASFVLVITVFLGMMLLLPALVVEALLLFKASRLLPPEVETAEEPLVGEGASLAIDFG